MCNVDDLHVEPIPAHIVDYGQVNLIFEVPIPPV